VRWLFLTHRDDVADHARFADHFGCTRILHHDDVTPDTTDVEMQPEGEAVFSLAPDLKVIPVPGHTKGHAVLLHTDRHLFTGDHLAWSERRGRLVAFRGACWYSWSHQVRSMRRLLDERFEWVLPGHGRRVHLPAAQMHRALADCVAWMETVA
jgi:glyoxylase-like metal-dependent hydrolase (beta-lactamase superfamily II)